MIGSVLLGTWGLTRIQQAKFDARDAKKNVVSKREKLGISAQPLDPQEIYFRLAPDLDDDWDFVRVQRPE